MTLEPLVTPGGRVALVPPNRSAVVPASTRGSQTPRGRGVGAGAVSWRASTAIPFVTPSDRSSCSSLATVVCLAWVGSTSQKEMPVLTAAQFTRYEVARRRTLALLTPVRALSTPATVGRALVGSGHSLRVTLDENAWPHERALLNVREVAAIG